MTLPVNYPIFPLLKSSLPPVASIYEADEWQPMALMRYGQGRIIYLGWNWHDAGLSARRTTAGKPCSAVENQGRCRPRADHSAGAAGRTTAVGRGVTLSVVATGTSPYSINGILTAPIFPAPPTRRWCSSRVTTNDSGTYRVTVSNEIGSAASAKAIVNVVELVDESFRIASLSSNNAVAVECSLEVGDDRGGIAVSTTHVFLTGDDIAGLFQLDGLASAGRRSPLQLNDWRREDRHCLCAGQRVNRSNQISMS
jgi:hypothetical protein